MAITGNHKFFSQSYLDIEFLSVTVTASSNAALGNNIRDRKDYTRWLSTGSDDTTTETITIEFGTDRTIDRLLALNNNWKQFDIQYWDGASYVDFTNVVTAEGSQSDVSETTNAKTTNYYEFDSITTDRIRIQIDTTQTVDAEKYVYQVLAMEEKGTFEGYPVYTPRHEIEKRKKTLLSGKQKFSTFDQRSSFTLVFNQYPPANDHQIVRDLFESRDEFYFWPCGGKDDQYRFELIGTRLTDIYLCQIDGDYSAWFVQNVYELSPDATLRLVEVG